MDQSYQSVSPSQPETIDPIIPSKKSRKQYSHDKKVHGKRYAPAVKLAIKSLQGSVSVDEAAALTGANRNTIVRAWEDPELEDLSPSVVRKTKIGLGGLFYKRALESSLAISAEKLSQSSALQLATVAGIMTEKGRLMEGLSTDNVSFRGVSQSIDEDRNKIMKRISELNGEISDNKT